MKRRLLVVLILVIVASLFAGCTPSQTESQKVFTLEELSKYDGKNGHPAYIAANNIVYDVSNSEDFFNGVHEQCSQCVAGTDVTALFKNSPHQSGKGMEELNKLPKVGTLGK